MRLIARLAAVAALILLPAVASAAEPVMAGALQISGGFSRATLPNQPVGGGYLTITNTGSEADRLVSASSPIAGVTQLHEMAVTDGVMRMAELPQGIQIPPGAVVELKPGGLHIMLMQLTQPLVEAEEVPLTLTFERAGTVEVKLTVGARDATAAGDHAGHSQHEGVDHSAHGDHAQAQVGARELPPQRPMDEMRGGCEAFAFPLAAESALFAADPIGIPAAKLLYDAPVTSVGTKLEIALEPHETVSFEAPPEQDRGGPNLYSGLVRVDVPNAGLYRVSASNGLWIDLVGPGGLIPSARFEMQTGCQAPFKSVAYELPAGELTVQLSGSRDPHVMLTILPWTTD